MRTWVSDPKPIRKFLRNFLLRSRKKFKLFFWLASQPASGPGPMDQGRTRAQWARAMGPGRDPWTRAGPGPGPMDQGQAGAHVAESFELCVRSLTHALGPPPPYV